MAAGNPNNTKVLFDRDMAKVYEVTLQAKDAASMHYGMDRLMYSCQAGQLVLIGPDGKRTKLALKKGECQWYPSGLQALENAGPNRTKLVVFGFKSSFLPYRSKVRLLRSVFEEINALGVGGAKTQQLHTEARAEAL